MDRRVTPPKGVTSSTWGPPPPCKQALSSAIFRYLSNRKCFTTVMQTLDFVSGLHNRLEFSQPLSCLYQGMQR